MTTNGTVRDEQTSDITSGPCAYVDFVIVESWHDVNSRLWLCRGWTSADSGYQLYKLVLIVIIETFSMARTKQTARGGSVSTPNRGRKRKPTTDDSSSDYYSPLSSSERSEGGQLVAKFPKRLSSKSPVKSPQGGGRASTSRGASRSSPARSNPPVPTRRSPRKGGQFSLPSFSTEDDDDEDDEQEVTLNIKGDHTDGGAGVQADPEDGAKQPRPTIAKKNLKKVKVLNSLLSAPRHGESSLPIVRKWNKQGRRKVPGETKRGWMKRGTRLVMLKVAYFAVCTLVLWPYMKFIFINGPECF